MDICRSIKLSCLKALKTPVIILLFCVAILILLPFFSVFHPPKTNDIYNISDDTKYVNATASTLYYSGYNLVGTIGKKYGYYYSLENNRCVFVLIPISENPKEILKNYHFKAKVTKRDKNFDEMADSFAKDLNWDKNSLLKSTENYILSNASYHPVIYIILFWIVLMFLFVNIKTIIMSVIGYFNPNFYPVCSFLGRETQKELLTEAQDELQSGMYIQINEMYITENYFIDLATKKISVIPLSDMVWCYRLGNRLIRRGDAKHNYSINFMIRTGSIISIPNKSSDEALELINAIRATEYDIIIGHSESKRKMAKKRCEK